MKITDCYFNPLLSGKGRNSFMDKSALQVWWRLFRSVMIFLGILLSFLAVVEILRVYIILRDFNSWVGLGFIALLVCCILWLLIKFIIAFKRLPSAPSPPKILETDTPTQEELLACGHFLIHRMHQVLNNPKLADSEREFVDLALSRLSDKLTNSLTEETILEAQEALMKIFKPIDESAERIVHECVRDVMLGVALSPYRSADLLIVIYRNGRMILQLAQLYYTRPAPAEQIRIFKDVIAIVATVNLLNFSEKFVEKLFTQIPILGQVAGDLSQGVGAGLLTSATGHAAIERCKSVYAWNRGEEQKHLANKMSSFVIDVKNIFQADLIPRIRPRLPEVTAVTEKVSKAFDSTAESMDQWIWSPVTKQSQALASATLRGSSTVLNGISSKSKTISQLSKSFFIKGKSLLGKTGGRKKRIERF
jgi:uncharacterized membrane protein YcjF (UPF0283 family)